MIGKLEVFIVQTQKSQEEIHKKQLHGNLEEKIDKLQNRLMDFKNEFINKFEKFGKNIYNIF